MAPQSTLAMQESVISDKEIDAAIRNEAKQLKQDHENLPTLVDSLLHRVHFHRDTLLKKQKQAMVIGTILNYGIPMFAAIITFLATLQPGSTANLAPKGTGAGQQQANMLLQDIPFLLKIIRLLPIWGLLLSLMTLYNTIYRPVEKRMLVIQLLINLHDLEVRLYRLLRRHNPGVAKKEKNLYTDLSDWDEELSKIGDKMAHMTLIPKTPEEMTNSKPGENNKRAGPLHN